MVRSLVELCSLFDMEFEKLYGYIETARRGGYQLHWRNYRKLYLSRARKAGRAFMELEKVLGTTDVGKPLVAALRKEMDILLNVETSTEQKVKATERFNEIWKQAKSAQGILGSLDSHRFFRERQFQQDPELCFVLMPFGDRFREVHKTISQAAKEVGLSPKRADDIFSIKPIVHDIWEYINRARVIVADLTGRNPNVFYEIGLAHAIEKNVVLISQNIDDVPFDLRHIRCIVYQDSRDGRRKLKYDLTSTFEIILGK